VLPVKGNFPTVMWPNAAFSKLYTLNDRSDNVSVIDTATRTVERVIDLRDYVPVPVPGAPFVGSQPANRTVQAGAFTEFACYGFNPRPTLGEPAVQWQVSTTGGAMWENVAGATATTFGLAPTTADDGKLFRAMFTNARGSSYSEAATLTVTGGPGPPSFADDPLQQRATPVKAIHVLQLRHRIDELRARYGLAAMTWTDDPLAARATVVKRIHLVELRDAIAAVYVEAGQDAPVFTDIQSGITPVAAAHLAEVRAAIVGIW